ncbi:YqgQ family protein [Alkalicoccus luteus]|uniref:YqgQ family protein n=1 Tax=Alkalicoccus luteus TaxID=1237094 RepID=A0A969PY24_9BACI|nr:YqgQ family protein [Alkalicoccus luteus]NJP37667.1 YqgQ family protein [Alkalicoccus luteus]
MTYAELLSHLRTYHMIVYTGDASADLDMIADELKEQYQLGIIDADFYGDALHAIQEKRSRLPSVKTDGKTSR